MPSRFIALFILMLVVALSAITMGQAFADPLRNASRQRIGNFDMQVATDPKNPVAGNNVKIQVRIAGVNGDDLANIPIQIKLVDSQGNVLQYSSPIIVPAGHYVYNYTFSQPGKYIVYVDLKDTNYSNSILTFTFFVNVAGPFDYLYNIVAPIGGAAAAGIVGTMLFIKRKKHKEMNADLR